MIVTPGRSSTRSWMAIAVRSSTSSATGIGSSVSKMPRWKRSSISSTGTSTHPDRRRKISSRWLLRRRSSQSTATESERWLSAKMRPSASKIRPRSGINGFVRTLVMSTSCCSDSASTVCKNQRRAPTSEKSRVPTTASTPSLVARLSAAMLSVCPFVRVDRRPPDAVVLHTTVM